MTADHSEYGSCLLCTRHLQSAVYWWQCRPLRAYKWTFIWPFQMLMSEVNMDIDRVVAALLFCSSWSLLTQVNVLLSYSLTFPCSQWRHAVFSWTKMKQLIQANDDQSPCSVLCWIARWLMCTDASCSTALPPLSSLFFSCKPFQSRVLGVAPATSLPQVEGIWWVCDCCKLPVHTREGTCRI